VAREIRLERLRGRVVRDAAGRRVGRIEEMRATRDGDDWVITHFLLGPAGWLERFSVRGWRLRLRTLAGARRRALRRLPWQALDLSDIDHPRLRRDSPVRDTARSTR